MIIEKRVIGSVAYLGRWALPEEFTWSWGQLIEYSNDYVRKPGERIYWMRGNKSGQYMTRNHIAANMIGDWLLLLDTDHAFEPDLLYRMLRRFNNPRQPLDVLTAIYQYKTPPYQPVLYQYFEGAERYRHVIGHDATDPNTCFKIDATGGGTLLVRRSVFERLEKAYPGEKPFDPMPPWGEDFSFFERLRRIGIVSHCCPAIQSYHLRTEETRMEQFDIGLTQLLEHTRVPSVQA